MIGRKENQGGPKAPRGTESAEFGVNLLSAWVLDELRVRRLRERFVYGALVLLIVVAGGWTYQVLSLRTAEADLQAQEARESAIKTQITELEPVQTYVDGVVRQATTVTMTMRIEVSFAQVLRQLDKASPDGITVSAAGVELLAGPDLTVPGGTGDATAAAAAPADTGEEQAADDGATQAERLLEDPARGLSGEGCPGPDPFDTIETIGCLTISGEAVDREAVSILVERLDRQRAFAEPFITTTTTGNGEPLVFEGTVGLTPRFFSQRYDDLSAALGVETTSEEKP